MNLKELFESQVDTKAFARMLVESSVSFAPVSMKSYLKEQQENELRYRELMEKGAKPIPVDTLKYGTWEIKYRTKPSDSGMFTAYGYHDRQDPIKAEGKSMQEVMSAIKAEIDKKMASYDTDMKFTQATVDYNVEFTRECLPDGPTGVRLVAENGGIYLIVCSPEYLDAFGDEIFGAGPDRFTRLFKRHTKTGEQAATVYGSPITVKQIKEFGLRPFGRYALEYDHKDMDYGHLYYKLVFDSVTMNKSDKRRLHAPGLTIAVF